LTLAVGHPWFLLFYLLSTCKRRNSVIDIIASILIITPT